MKSVCLACILLSFIQVNSYNQVIQADIVFSDLENSGKLIENIIDLNLSYSEYKALRSTTGEKVAMWPNKIVINGDTLKPKKIKTRGKSTLMYKRKSLSIKLKSKASFRHGVRAKTLKKFSLLSLSMDQYYCRNRLAFEMMDTLGIFKLFYSFCELRINGNSEGVFMIVERPEDWALKEQNSPLVLRRGFRHKIDETKAGKKVDRTATKSYLADYRQIYSSLAEYEGEELYTFLREHIDMDFYMRWLAFNYLVRNGDYCDEVFFYVDPEINKYRIIPWDYDDIFAITPHEGAKQRNKLMGDKMMFSSEDLLDKKIATDPYLYEAYLRCLKEVLETLSPGLLKQVVENTYAELYPYYSDNRIIGNAQFDCYRDASLEHLRRYLSDICSSLCSFRISYLDHLEPIASPSPRSPYP